ncbi:hypothetical protein [Cupriavidus sp. WS]|nr:hypothetical protein [Cupriavidus sp. WS]
MDGGNPAETLVKENGAGKQQERGGRTNLGIVRAAGVHFNIEMQ